MHPMNDMSDALLCCLSFDAGTAYGQTMPLDDPTMGWARYAQVRIHACATRC